MVHYYKNKDTRKYVIKIDNLKQPIMAIVPTFLAFYYSAQEQNFLWFESLLKYLRVHELQNQAKPKGLVAGNCRDLNRTSVEKYCRNPATLRRVGPTT
jgi:hypothetical protein